MYDAPVSPPSVSQAIQGINKAVDSGDASQTLSALRAPGVGLYGVTQECSQNYQDDLAKIKEDKKKEGRETMADGWIEGRGGRVNLWRCLCLS